MRVGLDFDNTIISYDALFHKVALEQNLVPGDTPRTKLAVRDHLRATGREQTWIEMQGYVYGARLLEAEPYPHALSFMHWARLHGILLLVVSHKTKHPFAGPRYDLHEIARQWIGQRLIDETGPLIPSERIFFELTKEEKLERIASCGCDAFVDDLPEILTAHNFPKGAQAIHFSPGGEDQTPLGALRVRGWRQLETHFAALCRTTY